MSKTNWKEGYKQLKKVIERLVKPRERSFPQPALQPLRPKPRFFEGCS